MSNNRTALMNLLSYAFLIAITILCLGCGDQKEKRPSPLRQDSIALGTTVITIEYSSPGVKKRKIWGELVPYDAVWRTGANKATYFKTTSDLIIDGEILEKGKYSIFTIPRERDDWTIIFNQEWDQWGSYNYEVDRDVLRVNVEPSESSSFRENMTFSLESDQLSFSWENLSYDVKFEIFQ